MEMGADYVIGVNVSSGLTPTEKLTNPVSILMNSVFFKEAEDSKKEIPLCNIYIPMPECPVLLWRTTRASKKNLSVSSPVRGIK